MVIISDYAGKISYENIEGIIHEVEIDEQTDSKKSNY